jgi:hypothetical protein
MPIYYDIPVHVEERPTSRRVTGVFLFHFKSQATWDVRLTRFMYFRSTFKASRYFAFHQDVVGQQLRRNRNTKDAGIVKISGLILMTPQMLAVIPGCIDGRRCVERLFPGLPDAVRKADAASAASKRNSAATIPASPQTSQTASADAHAAPNQTRPGADGLTTGSIAATATAWFPQI